MTDEERQKCLAELRTADELAFYWRKLAADEIERMVKELTELKATFRAAAIELGDPRTRQQHPERQRKF